MVIFLECNGEFGHFGSQDGHFWNVFENLEILSQDGHFLGMHWKNLHILGLRMVVFLECIEEF